VAKYGEPILGLTPPDKQSSASPQDHNVLIVYETFASHNKRKKALRELNQIYQVTAAQPWAATPITFNKKDEPSPRNNHAPAALVLDPIVHGFWLTKVLMDGGSGLNLIYEDTLDKMQFNRSRIECSHTTF
jgi:hypothetical protein